MLWKLPSLKNGIHSLEDMSSKSEWSCLKFAIVSIVDFYHALVDTLFDLKLPIRFSRNSIRLPERLMYDDEFDG